MGVDEVRIGMKGYGLTVFHGTVIEPFNVEVISIVPNKRPNFSVIWIRCDDPRMAESGPVKGMSGSPIYLWEEGEPHELGKGGKLIGAFAFGFSETKQCLVGVQPIAYMREAIARVPKEPVTDTGAGAGSTSGLALLQTLDSIEAVTPRDPSAALARFRIEQLRSWVNRGLGIPDDQADYRMSGLHVVGPVPGTQAQAMMLPISMGSIEAAELFTPLYEPLGMTPVAAPSGAIGGEPPHDVDAQSTMLEPGSVIAIPLAFGDLDLGATGTVTDILPTGEVLALGHPMSGEGRISLPMATGYVHFVVPRISISFKNGASLIPQGTLVRDEGAGTVGIPEKTYTTAAVEMTVRMPELEDKHYQYHVVTHPLYGPRSTANVIFLSINSMYDPPLENTFRLKAEMAFTGGRRFTLDTLVAGGNARNVVPELMPVLSAMAQNPFQSLELESAKVDVAFERGVRLSAIVGGQLDRGEVAPGETVSVDLELKQYAGPTEYRRVELKLPDNLPEGEYPLTVSGVEAYAKLVTTSNPHRMVANSMDDLCQLLQESMDYRTDAIYVTLKMPDAGLTLGRTELPGLPSSRSAILQSPTRPSAVMYSPLVAAIYDSQTVIQGDVAFKLRVRKP